MTQQVQVKTIKIPVDLIQQAEEVAQVEDLNFSQLLRKALRQYLQQNAKKTA